MATTDPYATIDPNMPPGFEPAVPPMPLPAGQSAARVHRGYPSLGRIVLVRTWGERIGGQEEHAGMIIGIRSDAIVDIMAFPRIGGPRSFPDVIHEGELGEVKPVRGDTTWRWPDRSV